MEECDIAGMQVRVWKREISGEDLYGSKYEWERSAVLRNVINALVRIGISTEGQI